MPKISVWVLLSILVIVLMAAVAGFFIGRRNGQTIGEEKYEAIIHAKDSAIAAGKTEIVIIRDSLSASHVRTDSIISARARVDEDIRRSLQRLNKLNQLLYERNLAIDTMSRDQLRRFLTEQ